MFTRLKAWWYFYSIRSWVNLYLYHKRELDEWENRFVTDDAETQRIKAYQIHKHIAGMEDSLHQLRWRLNVPMNEWVDDGNGREFMYNNKDLIIRG